MAAAVASLQWKKQRRKAQFKDILYNYYGITQVKVRHDSIKWLKTRLICVISPSVSVDGFEMSPGQMCEHAIIKDNLSDYPSLKNLMPEEYVYHICSCECQEGDNFKAHLKLKLCSQDEVQKWQEDFQASSGLIWRKAKTYPDVGQGSNKYRVDLRCQHNTRSSSKTKRNTCCPAFMKLILKRQTYSQGRKSRSENAHIKEDYYFTVDLNNIHNHPITCAAALAKRDVSKHRVGKRKKLFESGHSPASDLDTLEYDLDLKEQEGSSYWRVAADCSEAAGCTGATAGLNEPTHLPKEEAAGCIEQNELENELAYIFKDLTLKLRGDPSFRAPIASFVRSYKAIATDSGLQSALFNFTKSEVKVEF
ncbi:uncharacterized protein LOC134462290 isoform X2 [Engraulis encrasicolus]|uniref:uncharacterized protein LOC134462290 isoform X2 n=1 Tax=Engraulis encrasicolus TaxID=184585 RepID=UPI002FCEDA02